MDINSYIESAIWSSSCWERMSGNNPTPFDMVEDCEGISDAAQAIMESELRDFTSKAELIIFESKDWESMGIELPSDSQIAHDFWLTRNGHGAGFWCRGTEELGERLTELSQEYEERHLYLNDETLEIEID